MDLALVAVIGGSWPPVTLVDVRCWIIDNFDIPRDSFHVKHYYPEDFIVMFTYIDDMLRVLHDALVGRAAFSLVFKRWMRQRHASAEELRYCITVRLHRLPAHVCNISAASGILGPGCANLVISS
jgi:hypothetical protein